MLHLAYLCYYIYKKDLYSKDHSSVRVNDDADEGSCVWYQRKSVIFSHSGWSSVLVSAGPLQFQLFSFGSVTNGQIKSCDFLGIAGDYFQALRNIIAPAALMVRQQSSLIITPEWEYSS